MREAEVSRDEESNLVKGLKIGGLVGLGVGGLVALNYVVYQVYNLLCKFDFCEEFERVAKYGFGF